MFTADELAAAVTNLQRERDELFALLQDVAQSVLDPAPGGLSVAYLSAQTLEQIRQRVHN